MGRGDTSARWKPSKLKLLISIDVRSGIREFLRLKWWRRWGEAHIIAIEPTKKPRFWTCCKEENGVAGTTESENCNGGKSSGGRYVVAMSTTFLYKAYPAYNGEGQDQTAVNSGVPVGE
jgi:hypothetical protein